jgi:hypothetical protein
MGKIYFALFIGLAAVNIGCDRWDLKLTLINHSPDIVFYEISFDGYFDKHPVMYSGGDTLWTHIYSLHPQDSTRAASIEGMSWEKTINERCNDSILTVFIFDSKLLKKSNPDSLLRNQLYTQKLIYKVKDLEELSWRIEIK